MWQGCIIRWQGDEVGDKIASQLWGQPQVEGGNVCDTLVGVKNF